VPQAALLHAWVGANQCRVSPLQRYYLSHTHYYYYYYSPSWTLASSKIVLKHLVSNFWSYSTEHIWARGCHSLTPNAQPRGPGYPCLFGYCQHSSQYHLTTHTSPLPQSCCNTCTMHLSFIYLFHKLSHSSKCFDALVSSSGSLWSMPSQVTQLFQMQLLVIQFIIKMFHIGLCKFSYYSHWNLSIINL